MSRDAVRVSRGFQPDKYGPCKYCRYPLVWLPHVTGPHSIHWRGKCRTRAKQRKHAGEER